MVEQWLPESALKSEHARNAIADCAARWAEVWIASDGGVELASDWRDESPDVDLIEIDRKNGIGLKYPPDPNHSLAGMLLGRRMSSKDARTKQDTELLDRLIARASGHFLELLCAGLSPTSRSVHSQGGDKAACELVLFTDQGTELIVISLDRAFLTEYAIKNSRASRARPSPLERAQALSDQPIQLSALVGRTKLDFADLVEIGVGDVLVLDRPVEQPLDLMINNETRGIESASLSLENDRLRLSIERTSDQW